MTYSQINLELIKQNSHLYDKLIENKENSGKGAAIINSLNEEMVSIY